MTAFRALGVCSFIFLVQFFYHLLVVEIDFLNLIVCLLIFLILSGSIFFTTRGGKVEFSLKNKRVFFLLFITSFVTTLLTSRIDYISATLLVGLADARNTIPFQAGGVFSAINVFFYPLALVALLTNWNRPLTLALLLPILVIDVIFLGTRNSVFFVIVFWFIHSQAKVSATQTVLTGLFIFIVLIFAFEYTVFERSGEAGSRYVYWNNKLEYSEIGGLNQLNSDLHSWARNIHWSLYPIAHLAAYLSHSISELVHFISNSQHRILPTFLHIQDSFLLATFQERGHLQAELADLKVRSGFYNTMFATWYIELGFLSMPVLFFILAWLRYGKFLAKLVGSYLIVVFALGAIENYLFTGLTIIRFGLFLLLGCLFLRTKTFYHLASGHQDKKESLEKLKLSLT